MHVQDPGPAMQEHMQSGRSGGILVCLTYHLPNISGLTLLAHEVAKHAQSHGFVARIVAGRVPRSMPAMSLAEGIEIRRVAVWGRVGKALVMPGYGLAVWRAMDGINVVNVHLPCLDAAVVALAARMRGRTLIVSHISSMSTATLTARLMRAVAAIPHLIAGMLAHRIVTVSEDYAEASTFCRLFRRKVVTAPYPISLPLMADEPPRLHQPRSATAEAPYRIGYVGRIAAQKSLSILLDVLPLLPARLGPHFVLELVGPSTDVVGESHWQEILAEATKHGGRVCYHGVKTGAALAEFYAGIDVLVLPSIDRLESFGLVQVEAMLRGAPVVASDLPGMRLPVQATQMGVLFEPGNLEQLANALARVLTAGPPRQCKPSEIEQLFGHDVACRPYMDLLTASTAGVPRR